MRRLPPRCRKCLNPPYIRFPRGADPGTITGGGTGASRQPVLPLKNFLREQEKAHLNRAIQQCGGDKEQAALLLGISIATLYRRLSEENEES